MRVSVRMIRTSSENELICEAVVVVVDILFTSGKIVHSIAGRDRRGLAYR